MGRSSLLELDSRHPVPDLVTAILVALLLAGVLVSVTTSRLTFYWMLPGLAAWTGLAVLIATGSAVVAYRSQAWPIPLFAVTPFVGLWLTHLRTLPSFRYDGVVHFASEALLAILVSGAGLGLAGGVAGYLVGTSARSLRLETDVPTRALARRVALAGLGTAVAVTLLGLLWINRGLGDAI